MEGNNFSLSDLRAVTDGADGISGGSAWLIILFLLIVGGNGFGGFGRNTGELNSYATAASQQDILFSSKFQALDNKIDRIGNGIADATFALNNSIKDTAYATTSAVVSEGRATQDAICNVRYDMANFAASINSNIDNKFAALEKSQLEQRLAEQSQQIAQLQLSSQLCGIPRINQTAWGVYPYPTCNTGCGCN
ncbi:MAG: hypothetical protein MJ168_12245 [Clostridia bacterium]|nr:hypothetical protein [Clostridia bacterium]